MTGSTSYPAAEAAARAMRLPLAVDPVARELYGVADAVLDEAAAVAGLRRAGIGPGPASDAALAILRDRAALAVQP